MDSSEHPCTSGYMEEPRKVATVGKKSAPQKVLVTEMGSVSGGSVDWGVAVQ